MKIALITDTHFGVRNDNPLFLEYFDKFLDNIFFPELKRRKIQNIVHLGDMMDRRKYVNFNTLTWARTFMTRARGFNIDLIIGNHDTYFKNTNDVNSPDLLLREYENLRIVSEPTEVDVAGALNGILYLPWITPENEQRTLDAIKNTSCKVVMGHLSLTGFQMHKGSICQDGMNPDLFEKFSSVFTGHFHSKHSIRNIHYLGCPWDLMFTDADDIKGFHIYDTDTDTTEFIENPYKMYWKFYYDDTGAKDLRDVGIPKNTLTKIKNTFVKVYIKGKTNPVLLDRYLAKINDAEPASLSIVDDYVNEDFLSEERITLDEDTLSLLNSSLNDYSDIINSEDKKAEIQKLLCNLYMEALKA
jgi:DNA repair exonuclease SbcCD nuclease subunit